MMAKEDVQEIAAEDAEEAAALPQPHVVKTARGDIEVEPHVHGERFACFLYSGRTGGFYHPHIHGTDLPDDVVKVSADEHAALYEALANGKMMRTDENGRPVAVDPPPPSPEDNARTRDNLLRDSAHRIAEDEPDREAWLAYRKQLREVKLDGAKVKWPKPPSA